MHHALVVEKDTVWIEASRVVVRVVRYLVKERAWHGIGVAAVFVFGLGVVLCFYVAPVYFVVDVHT